MVLATLATDVDRRSGGRVVLGLGSGDMPPEFPQLGLTWPPPRERQGQDVAAASDDLAHGRVGHLLAQRPADELLAHLLDAADNASVGPARSLLVA